MRRKVFALAALMALAVCGVAYAATNNSYSATYTAKAKGTTAKPVAVGMTEVLKVTPPESTDRGGYPLKKIVSKISDLKAPNGKDFKTCTVAEINKGGASGKWNTVCPSGSQVATGTVKSSIGQKGNLSKDGAIQCNLDLHVYNAGAGKLTYFFTVPTGACAGLVHTGDALPFPGTTKESGTTLINTVPEPADVSTNAANLGSLWGSLQSETLNWSKLTVKKSGKTLPFLESIGCKAGKRSSSTTFTATNGSKTVSSTVASKTSC